MYAPKFTITPQITNWVAQIEAIKQKLAQSRILPEQEIALRHRAAIESVHSSTSIEGNPLSEKQIEAALMGKMNTWEKKVIEVVNYKKAWDWINRRSKKKSEITIKDILRLHALVADQLLAKQKVGQFRPGSIYIVDIVKGKDVLKYTGAAHDEVHTLIEDLLHWVHAEKNNLHPVLLAGILHYEFVSIHPFSDGNGRVTRLLVKLFLDLLSYDFRGCLVLDTYYWQNTTAYYEALHQAKIYKQQRKADMTVWLSYFVEGFYSMVKELERKIDVVGTSDQGEILRLSDDEIQILDFVHQFGQIGLQDVLDILKVPERTGQRRLKTIIDKELLQRIGKGKNTKYIVKQ